MTTHPIHTTHRTTATRGASRSSSSAEPAIGRLIGDCRNRRGWTQRHLARRSGLAKDTLCRIERAKYRAPNDTIVRILEALAPTR